MKRLDNESGFVVVAILFVGLFALLAGAIVGARYPRIVAPTAETYILPELPTRTVPKADLPPKKAPEAVGSGDYQTGY